MVYKNVVIYYFMMKSAMASKTEPIHDRAIKSNNYTELFVRFVASHMEKVFF
jgi:hypothetical protein